MTDTTQGADALDDAALFNEATSTETTLEKFENPVLEKPDAKPAEKPTEKPAEKSGERSDQQEAPVPAGRLREETEARRRMERERDELRGRLDVYERMQQQRPPQQQHETPQADIFEDPRGFVQQEVHPIIAQVMAAQRRDREILSENWAIRQHGRDKVVTARETLGQGLQMRDPEAIVTYQQAMQSPDPYDVIMQWHARRETLSSVGGDIDAYRSRILEEALKDPEYQKRVIAAARGQAQHVNVPAGQQRPSVSPSLSDIGAGGRDEQQQEPSDLELFRAVTTAKRRR